MVYFPTSLFCTTLQNRQTYDSAHAHRARDTKSNSCSVKQLISFIQSYGPNSPDLNPVDYKIWGIMRQRVYEIHNVDELQQRLVDLGSGLQQSVVDAAVRELREGKTLRTSAVGCFDNGMKLSIGNLCTTQRVFEVFNNSHDIEWKDAIFVLSVLQGSAETLFRWDRIINDLLIA